MSQNEVLEGFEEDVWEFEQEDWDWLDSLPGENEVLAMRGHFDPTASDIDARDILKTENQGRQGSCQGHAITTTGEWIAFLLYGIRLQLSRAMGYYETQRGDGIRGDRGSTISGGAKLLLKTGICLEELWPYPSRYDNDRPNNFHDEILPNAEKHRAGNIVRLESYQGVKTFLEAGLGGISIGIRWNKYSKREHVTSFRGGAGGGGHAIMSPQMSRKRPGDLDINNSHSLRWGDKGWATWAEAAVDAMFRDRYTVFIGISDMPNLEPRVLSYEEMRKAVLGERPNED